MSQLSELKRKRDDIWLKFMDTREYTVTNKTPYDVRGGDVYGGDEYSYTVGADQKRELRKQLDKLDEEIRQLEEAERKKTAAAYNPRDEKMKAYEKAKERYENLSLFQKLPHMLHKTGIKQINLNLTTRRELEQMFQEGEARGR